MEELNEEQFKAVEVPDFLFEKIKNKIEKEESTNHFQSRFLMVAAIFVFFINLGVLSQYEMTSDVAQVLESNPYSTINYSYYD